MFDRLLKQPGLALAILLLSFGGLFPTQAYSRTSTDCLDEVIGALTAEAPDRPLGISKADVPLELEKNEELIEGYRKSIQERGMSEREKIIAAMKNHKPLVYDAVVVGAGPQASSLVSTIKATRPDAKILVLEETPYFGTFDRFGPSFRVNTLETKNYSANNFVGAPLQPKHLNFQADNYMLARSFGDVTVSAFEHTEVPVIFGSKASKEPAPAGSPATFRVTTNDGLMVDSHNPVLMTGMGPPRKDIDPEMSRISKEEHEKALLEHAKGNYAYAPMMEGSSALLLRMKRAHQTVKRELKLYGEVRTQPFEAYNGRIVGVGGKGDGAYVTTSVTDGDADGLQIPGVNPPSPKKIYLLGQSSKTGSEFLENLFDKFIPRYGKAAKHYAKVPGGPALYQPVDGRVLGVSRSKWPDGRDSLKVKLQLPDGTLKEVEMDYFHPAFGYIDVTTPWVQELAEVGKSTGSLGEFTWTAEIADLSDFNLYPQFQGPGVIGDRVAYREGAIWLGGNGAPSFKRIAPPAETGGFIDFLSPRSAALGRKIANSIRREPSYPVRHLKEGKIRQEFKNLFSIGDVPRHSAVATLRNEGLVELARELLPLSLPPKKKIILEIFADASKRTVITGLTRKDAEILGNTLQKNRRFSRVINDLGANGRRRIRIEVPVRSDGTIRTEKLSFEAR